jgi:hypothetical protein
MGKKAENIDFSELLSFLEEKFDNLQSDIDSLKENQVSLDLKLSDLETDMITLKDSITDIPDGGLKSLLSKISYDLSEDFDDDDDDFDEDEEDFDDEEDDDDEFLNFDDDFSYGKRKRRNSDFEFDDEIDDELGYGLVDDYYFDSDGDGI